MPCGSRTSRVRPIDGSQTIWPARDARALAEELCASDVRAELILRQLEGSQVVMWAPRVDDQLQRLCANVRKVLTRDRVSVRITLVVTREPLPLINQAELLSDVWPHTLFGR